jgi:group I intron endonuclease
MNFQNSKIYKVFSTVSQDIFVGSTTGDLKSKLLSHKSLAKKNPQAGSNAKLHTAMNTLGSNLFQIELLESFTCENKAQMLTKEREYIQQLQPAYNTNISESPTIAPVQAPTQVPTQEQVTEPVAIGPKKEAARLKAREYYQKNKDNIKAKQQEKKSQ